MVVGLAESGYPDDFPVFPGCNFVWTEEILASGETALKGTHETVAGYRDVRDYYCDAIGHAGRRYKSTEIQRSRSWALIQFEDTSRRLGNGELFVLAPSWSRKATRVIVYLKLPPGLMIMLLKERRPGVLGLVQSAIEFATLPYYLIRIYVSGR